MKKIVTLIIILFFGLSSQVWAGCSGLSPSLTADSPSFADVSACVSASTYDDVITVPAGSGSATWNSQLEITKGVKILGPGAGSLTITSGYNGQLIKYAPDATSIANDDVFVFSGFTLALGSGKGAFYLYSTSNTPSTKIVITNNTITNCALYAVDILGSFGGVFANNTINGTSDLYFQIQTYSQQGSWENNTFQPGTENAFYFEDNDVTTSATSPQPWASSQGAYPWVSRYNTLRHTGNGGLQSWHDMHGNLGAGNVYGSIGAEIYGNYAIETYTTTNSHRLLYQRGGQALCFWNRNNNTYGDPDDPQLAITSAEEVLDSSNETSGSYASGTNQVNGQPQHVSNSYYWNNRDGGGYPVRYTTTDCCSVTYSGCTDCGATPQIVVNREFWRYVTSGFDGTAGVGCGTLASRPATCTPGSGDWPASGSGPGYWATTQDCSTVASASSGANPSVPISGTLYQCTATDTWTSYYTPYTYPHPLRSEADPDTTAPTISGVSGVGFSLH